MATRYTVSPYGDGYAVFDDGLYHTAPISGTWGAAKKIADRLNDEIRPIKMKYQPQLAKASSKGAALPPGNWILERKWDGVRAIFEISETETLIFSRTGQDMRPQFPELLDLHERLRPCILDGEIVAIGEDGVENLELLQMRLGDKQARRQSEVPVQVVFFDVLEQGGYDTRDFPLAYRRGVMERLLEGSGWELPETIEIGDEVPSHWEGFIAKLTTSKYESGKRRASWTKWKFVERATLWAAGLTPGKGARSGAFGAVLVEDANGIFRGQVGSGFTQEVLEEVMHLSQSGEKFLVEVEYRFLSKTGLMVNTAFKGIRRDKSEADAL